MTRTMLPGGVPRGMKKNRRPKRTGRRERGQALRAIGVICQRVLSGGTATTTFGLAYEIARVLAAVGTPMLPPRKIEISPPLPSTNREPSATESPKLDLGGLARK